MLKSSGFGSKRIIPDKSCGFHSLRVLVGTLLLNQSIFLIDEPLS
ncbi:hypothetical protein HG66A1_24470 [Gimesia chilikensis]|uniref:Uncharacterized protein n=1 Tax=Gimesia chilikensis TaxID=2605989 RepID=A0A517PMQ6_9PLAN|nr:hypothetical protein HG66A1_24470 [Gimesia chilikensis]